MIRRFFRWLLRGNLTHAEDGSRPWLLVTNGQVYYLNESSRPPHWVRCRF